MVKKFHSFQHLAELYHVYHSVHHYMVSDTGQYTGIDVQYKMITLCFWSTYVTYSSIIVLSSLVLTEKGHVKY